MTLTINILKGQKAILEKRLAKNPDFKEYNILCQTITALSSVNLTEPSVEEPRMGHHHAPKPSSRKRRFSRKNNKDVPEPHVNWGDRVTSIYNKIEAIVKENGGELDIPIIAHKLRADYGIVWKPTAGFPGDRVANTIITYNKMVNSAGKRNLVLYPFTPAPGKQKVRKYTKVFTKTAINMRKAAGQI